MNKEFDDLWEHFLSDNLSEEESKKMQHLLATKDQQIPEAIDKLLLDQEVKGAAPRDKEDLLLERILSAAARERPPLVRRIGRYWQGAAAAIILLTAGLAWYFVARNGRNNNPAPPAAIAKNAILPGHSGAILTLSNGKEIVLDSAGNGLLASDSHVKVVKKEGAIAYEGKSEETVYNNVSTPKGRAWQLTLSDGTKVWLNALSSIRYPVSFTDKERTVEVTGEAYFEVAHNDQSPFVVKTPQQEIRVLGTHFDVNVYGDEPVFRTTLLEGSVKVTAGKASVVLRPGEQVAHNYSTGLMTVKNAEGNDVIAWINGRFKFDHSDIKTVMRQIARWYDVDIEYRGDMPDYEFAGGTFRNSQLPEILHMLELSGVHFKVENRKIIVMQ